MMIILQQGKQPILDDDVNLEELAQLTESFTGADLAGLVRQASLQALRDSLKFESASEEEIDLKVHKQHFMSALQQMRPSVSTEVMINALFTQHITSQCIFKSAISQIIILFIYNFRTKFNMNYCD